MALIWSGALHVALLGACLAVSAPRSEPPVLPAETAVELVTLAAGPAPRTAELETIPAQPDETPPLPAETAPPEAPISIPRPPPPRVRRSVPRAPVRAIATEATAAVPAPAVAPVAASRLPPEYTGQITARLLAVKRYPPQARALGDEGTILISLTLAADGTVISTHIGQSSGVPSLDAEGLSMVARAAPFPPLPDGFKGALLVPIAFSLRGR